jgi:predicted nuclease with TOPRIM domain
VKQAIKTITVQERGDKMQDKKKMQARYEEICKQMGDIHQGNNVFESKISTITNEISVLENSLSEYSRTFEQTAVAVYEGTMKSSAVTELSEKINGAKNRVMELQAVKNALTAKKTNTEPVLAELVAEKIKVEKVLTAFEIESLCIRLNKEVPAINALLSEFDRDIQRLSKITNIPELFHLSIPKKINTPDNYTSFVFYRSFLTQN